MTVHMSQDSQFDPLNVALKSEPGLTGSLLLVDIYLLVTLCFKDTIA